MQWATVPGIVLASAVLLVYCLEIPTGYFVEWRFAGDFKEYIRTINARSPGKTVRIGGSSEFWYLTNFYHDMRLCKCEQTIDEDSRKAGYDYYVLLPDDRQYVDQLGLSVLQETGQSILAAPGRAATARAESRLGDAQTADSSRAAGGLVDRHDH